MKHGILVFSLDFELHWGLRDIKTLDEDQRQIYLRTRQLIPKLLKLFEKYKIAATWATVGCLFSENRKELLKYCPLIQPNYFEKPLEQYIYENLGDDEGEDPYHYASTIISNIREYPKQEVATHTFSHYYCLEERQNASTFKSDLSAAIQIAKDNGISVESIIFPRNQYNDNYDDILKKHGIRSYRGNSKIWFRKEAPFKNYKSGGKRVARFLDTYVGIFDNHLSAKEDIIQKNGLVNIPASFFVGNIFLQNNWLKNRSIKRIKNALKQAAVQNKIIHLWLHPHNMASNTDAFFIYLESILEYYSFLKKEHKMESYNMKEFRVVNSKTFNYR